MADPLFQALFQQGPFLARKDPRNHVERDQPLLGFGVAIDREGDPDPAEQQLRFLAAILQRFRGRLLQPSGELMVSRAEVAAGQVHFIKRDCHKS